MSDMQFCMFGEVYTALCFLKRFRGSLLMYLECCRIFLRNDSTAFKIHKKTTDLVDDNVLCEKKEASIELLFSNHCIILIKMITKIELSL